MVCVSESFILWLGEGGEIWQLEASCSLPSVHYRPQHEGGEQEGGEDDAQRASRQAFFFVFLFLPRDILKRTSCLLLAGDTRVVVRVFQGP